MFDDVCIVLEKDDRLYYPTKSYSDSLHLGRKMRVKPSYLTLSSKLR